MDGPEFSTALARLVNFAVGASGQRFEILPEFRLGGEGRDAGEIGGGLLIEEVKALHLLERHLAGVFFLDAFEHFLQLGPGRPFSFDEAGKIDDHTRGRMRGYRSCRCLISACCAMSSVASFSGLSIEKRTPRRFRTLPNSRNCAHCKWPPRR